MKIAPALATSRPDRALRLRQRHALACGLFLLANVIIFTLWPGLDLICSQWFFTPAHGFVGDRIGIVYAVYVAVPWFGRLAFVAALLVWLARPGWLPIHRRRQIIWLGITMLLAVGVMVNMVIKDYWGRARPSATVAFGGQEAFTPALQPTSRQESNSSFTSGHAATGFALMSLGLLSAPARRRRWLRLGLAAGLLVGVGRMAQGGHFLSDVLFSGVAVWVFYCLLQQLWLRSRALRRWRYRQAQPHAPM